jgi:2-polyprenyl-3-methyl-5-hydroxy-6-metoxy-1,4-benzoquinol methylase
MDLGGIAGYRFKDFDHSSHRVLLRWAGAGPGKVLDAGAGFGFLGRPLAAAGYTVVGLDANPAAARRAPAEYAAFHTLDVSSAPVLPEAPFDVVVAGDVLEHVAQPPVALACLLAQLRPGGRLLISVPNVAFAAVRLELAVGRFQYRPRGILDETHLRFFTRRSFRRLMSDAGLTLVRMMGVPAPLPLLSRRFATLPGRLVFDATALAARLWPTLLAYQFVAEARR